MKKLLFIIPIIFLALPFINIHFALLAFFCFMAPIYLLVKTKSRSFCQNYCPRSKLLTKTKLFSKQKNAPKIFSNGKLRTFFLGYFVVNLLFIITTTVLVANGIIEPMLKVRFLFFIPLFNIPEIFTINSLPWLIHLSYRLYSMILTTILLGIIFAYFYRPRTWCQVCPITSVNNIYLS